MRPSSSTGRLRVSGRSTRADDRHDVSAPNQDGTGALSGDSLIPRLERGQTWRLAEGILPGCPVGTVVTLSTKGRTLEVTRPWVGVVAQLDTRVASVTTANGARDLVLRSAGGDVVFRKDDGIPLAPIGSVVQPQVSSLIGQAVEFAGKVRNAQGLNQFEFLVFREAHGWILGLTRNGHPAGIATENIAWARVVEPGPASPPDPLYVTYVGAADQCILAYQSEAPTLSRLGYVPVARSFVDGSRDVVVAGVALLIGHGAWRASKPPGTLTVTFRRVGG